MALTEKEWKNLRRLRSKWHSLTPFILGFFVLFMVAIGFLNLRISGEFLRQLHLPPLAQALEEIKEERHILLTRYTLQDVLAYQAAAGTRLMAYYLWGAAFACAVVTLVGVQIRRTNLRILDELERLTKLVQDNGLE